jgi:hypothetical protein
MVIFFLVLLLQLSIALCGPPPAASQSGTRGEPEADLSIFQFTEDGDVKQFQYAAHHVSSFSPPLAAFASAKRGIAVIVVGVPHPSHALELEQEQTGTLLLDGVILGLTGFASDVAYVRTQAHVMHESHTFTFGEGIPLPTMAGKLSEFLTAGMCVPFKTFPCHLKFYFLLSLSFLSLSFIGLLSSLVSSHLISSQLAFPFCLPPCSIPHRRPGTHLNRTTMSQYYDHSRWAQ